VDLFVRKTLKISRLFRFIYEAFGGNVERMSAFSGSLFFAKAKIGGNQRPTAGWLAR
jgi:hypothetical protein